MSTSRSRLAFQDCITIYQKAMEDEFGCRVRMKDRSAAINFRMRMHTARQLDRDDNKFVYRENESHQLYGRSVFDQLVCKIRYFEGSWWIYVQKMSLPGEVEALSELSYEARDVANVVDAEFEPIQNPRQLAETLKLEHFKRRI